MKNFLRPKKSLFQTLFQAWRSTGPVDRAGRPDLLQARPVDRALCPGCARLCTSISRPTGRPTGRPTRTMLLSVSYRSTDRSTDSSRKIFPLVAGRPTGRPSPTTICQMDCRSTGPVDRQPSLLPNGSFFFGEILIWFLFCWQIILIFWGLFLDQINLI